MPATYVQVYKRDYQGETAMHTATQYGSKEALRFIVRRDREDPGTDGLHILNKWVFSLSGTAAQHPN